MLQAALLVILIVSVVVGGISGLALGGIMGGLPLALAASLLSLAAAWIAHELFVNRGAVRPRRPMRVIAFSVVTSLIGSLSAIELTRDLALRPGMTGAIAGLLAAVMMIMLLICYGWRPGA
jgi:hypothetical protein